MWFRLLYHTDNKVYILMVVPPRPLVYSSSGAGLLGSSSSNALKGRVLVWHSIRESAEVSSLSELRGVLGQAP